MWCPEIRRLHQTWSLTRFPHAAPTPPLRNTVSMGCSMRRALTADPMVGPEQGASRVDHTSGHTSAFVRSPPPADAVGRPPPTPTRSLANFSAMSSSGLRAVWSVLREPLTALTFGQMKEAAAAPGLPTASLSHLRQTSSGRSASKAELADAIDDLFSRLDPSSQDRASVYMWLSSSAGRLLKGWTVSRSSSNGLAGTSSTVNPYRSGGPTTRFAC